MPLLPLPTPAPLGPRFWDALVAVPSGCALCAAAGAASAGAAPVWPAGAEGFLVACFAIASLQLPFLADWQRLVEGDLGMPRWVHRCAGLAELAVVSLRCWGGGGLKAALLGDRGAQDRAVARRCGAAHVLTCGLMGGALYVWPFGVKLTSGLAPAAMVMSTSAAASWRWLAACGTAERRLWNLGAASAAAAGAVAAKVLRRPA